MTEAHDSPWTPEPGDLIEHRASGERGVVLRRVRECTEHPMQFHFSNEPITTFLGGPSRHACNSFRKECTFEDSDRFEVEFSSERRLRITLTAYGPFPELAR